MPSTGGFQLAEIFVDIGARTGNLDTTLAKVKPELQNMAAALQTTGAKGTEAFGKLEGNAARLARAFLRLGFANNGLSFGLARTFATVGSSGGMGIVIALAAALVVGAVALDKYLAHLHDFDTLMEENKARTTGETARADAHFQELSKLLNQETRNNAEQRRANELARELTATYGDLGISINKVGDAYAMSTSGAEKFLKAMTRQRMEELEREAHNLQLKINADKRTGIVGDLGKTVGSEDWWSKQVELASGGLIHPDQKNPFASSGPKAQTGQPLKQKTADEEALDSVREALKNLAQGLGDNLSKSAEARAALDEKHLAEGEKAMHARIEGQRKSDEEQSKLDDTFKEKRKHESETMLGMLESGFGERLRPKATFESAADVIKNIQLGDDKQQEERMYERAVQKAVIGGLKELGVNQKFIEDVQDQNALKNMVKDLLWSTVTRQ
jgi:hypothetical protein